MKVTSKNLIAMAAAMTLLVSHDLFGSENLFRYRNHSGEIVIDDKIPPEFVADGYEVLSRTGRVVETVPAQQIEVVPELKPDQQMPAVDKEAQRREDTILLRSYSTLEELEAARDRRLELLDREIVIVESNLEKSREYLEDSRAKAANHQRSGRVVPQALLDNIADQEEQISDAEQMSIARAEDRRAVNEKYQHYIERFTALKGLQSDSSAEKSRPSTPATDPASTRSDDG